MTASQQERGAGSPATAEARPHGEALPISAGSTRRRSRPPPSARRWLVAGAKATRASWPDWLTTTNVAVVVSGTSAYTSVVTFAYANSFYSVLGTTPEEVGLTQANLLVRGAIAGVLFASIIVGLALMPAGGLVAVFRSANRGLDWATDRLRAATVRRLEARSLPLRANLRRRVSRPDADPSDEAARSVAALVLTLVCLAAVYLAVGAAMGSLAGFGWLAVLGLAALYPIVRLWLWIGVTITAAAAAAAGILLAMGAGAGAATALIEDEQRTYVAYLVGIQTLPVRTTVPDDVDAPPLGPDSVLLGHSDGTTLLLVDDTLVRISRNGVFTTDLR